MGREEREKLLEKALGRQLRGDGAAEGKIAGAACPDAEMLAALHEGRLSGSEMDVVKEHVAGCKRCEEILAELRATDEVAVGAKEKVSRMKAAATGVRAIVSDSETAEAGVEVGGAARGTGPREISSGRKKRWVWTAPAGAIAAGLLIWVVTHEMRQASLTPAENRAKVRLEFQTVGPNTEKPNDTTTVAQNDARTQNVAPLPSQRGKQADGNQKIARSRNLREIAPPKPVLPYAPGAKTDEFATAMSTDKLAERAVGEKSADLPIMGRSAMEEEELEAKAKSAARVAAATAQPSAPPGAPANAKPAEQSGEATSEMAKVEEPAAGSAEGKKGASPGAPKESARVARGAGVRAAGNYEGDISSLRKDKGTDGGVGSDWNLISAPGGAALWRVGRAGAMERSVDGGITWVRQSSGVTVDLLRGVAVSEVVCWVVGRGGLVLRSVDGGGHWMKAGAPIEDDGVTIRAEDGMHATISNAGRSKSFATSDGGVTWVRVGTE